MGWVECKHERFRRKFFCCVFISTGWRRRIEKLSDRKSYESWPDELKLFYAKTDVFWSSEFNVTNIREIFSFKPKKQMMNIYTTSDPLLMAKPLLFITYNKSFLWTLLRFLKYLIFWPKTYDYVLSWLSLWGEKAKSHLWPGFPLRLSGFSPECEWFSALIG